MNKKLKMVDKIISGQKTIESRWYKTRRAPWDRMKAGDTIYFKETGEKVCAKAKISKVVQFELRDTSLKKELVERFHKHIALTIPELIEVAEDKNYLILAYLVSPVKLDEEFDIDKSGFGLQTSWITIENINQIKLSKGFL